MSRIEEGACVLCANKDGCADFKIGRRKCEDFEKEEILDGVEVDPGGVSRVLRELRFESCKNVDDICNEVGYCQTTLSNWEKGESTIPLTGFIDFMNFYGYELIYRRKK